MNEMTGKTCEQFLIELASKSAVPGGGGASAMVGALGIALGNMVGNLTVGKKKYANVEADIQTFNIKAEKLRLQFEQLITDDAVAFAPLSKAYSLPRSTQEEIEYREKVLEDGFKRASEVPFKIMKACCEAIDLLGEYAQKGSVIAISDAGCGVIMCKSAMQAASLNVLINTKSMKDRAYAENLNTQVEQMLLKYCEQADKIFNNVADKLKK